MNEKAKKDFEKLCNPLIKWLNDNMHPHAQVIITPDSAELVEGLLGYKTDVYIKD